MKTRDKLKKIYADDNKQLDFNNIVILVNGMTASASELFIIALKENIENVTLLGETTYGKDIFYGIREFQDQSAMFFITSVMQGPKGTQYADGIAPDIYEDLLNESTNTDNQLESAIMLLNEK